MEEVDFPVEYSPKSTHGDFELHINNEESSSVRRATHNKLYQTEKTDSSRANHKFTTKANAQTGFKENVKIISKEPSGSITSRANDPARNFPLKNLTESGKFENN